MNIYEKNVALMLSQFMIDCMNHFAPRASERITLQESNEFIFEWVEKRFRYPEIPDDSTSKKNLLKRWESR